MKSLREYFEKEFDVYYSGSDVEVFIGNTLVDECTMIGWKTVSTQGPAFSYNKEKFSTILNGKVHVEGQIAVNFVSTGYLEYIIMKSHLEPQAQLGLAKFRNPARSAEEANKEGLFYYNLYKKKPDIISSSEVKDKLRNYLWGNRNELSDLTYKNGSHPSIADLIRDDVYFNILVIFGNMHGTDYTMRTIVNAKIVGNSMEIANDGTPIQLIYSFVAQSADAPITPKAKQLNIPIGQKLPLYKIPDYIERLGQEIVNKNVVGSTSDPNIFLPLKRLPIDKYYMYPNDFFTSAGMELVPFSLVASKVESKDNLASLLLSKETKDNIKPSLLTGLQVYDSNGNANTIAKTYDLYKDIDSDEMKVAVADNLINNIFITSTKTYNGNEGTVYGEIKRDDALGYYGGFPIWLMEGITKSFGIGKPNSVKAVAEIQFIIKKIKENYGDIASEYLNSEISPGGIGFNSKWDGEVDEAHKNKAIGKTEVDILKEDVSKFLIDGSFGHTTEAHVKMMQWIFKKLHDSSDRWSKKYTKQKGYNFGIDGKVGKTTLTMLDNIAREYFGWYVNREGLEYISDLPGGKLQKIPIDQYGTLTPNVFTSNVKFDDGLVYGEVSWKKDENTYYGVGNSKVGSGEMPDKAKRIAEVQWALNKIYGQKVGNVTVGVIEQDGYSEKSLYLIKLINRFLKDNGLRPDGAISKKGITTLDRLMLKNYNIKINATRINPFKSLNGLISLPPVNIFNKIVKYTELENGKLKLPFNVNPALSIDKINVKYVGLRVDEPPVVDTLPDSYMFVFGQPHVGGDEVKHFDFEFSFSDIQDDISRSISSSTEFPINSKAFIAIPRLMNKRKISLFKVDDKPFVKSVKSFVQVLFDESWADGLYLTGAKQNSNEKSDNEKPSDMENAVVDISYNNEAMDDFIGERMTDNDVNVFDGIDDIKMMDMYYDGPRLDHIGSFGELAIYPFKNMQVSEMPDERYRPNVLFVKKIEQQNVRGRFNFNPYTTIDKDGKLNKQGKSSCCGKGKGKCYQQYLNSAFLLGIDYICNKSELPEDLNETIKQVADSVKKHNYTLKIEIDIDNSFIEQLFGNYKENIRNGDFIYSVVLTKPLEIRYREYSRNVSKDEEWNMSDPDDEDTYTINPTDVWIDIDNDLKVMRLYITNNPLDLDDLPDDTSDYQDSRLAKLIGIGLGFPKLVNDDDETIEYGAILDVGLDEAGVIVFGLPKQLGGKNLPSKFGYYRIDPAISVDSDNFKAIMLPLPIPVNNRVRLFPNEFVSVDEFYVDELDGNGNNQYNNRRLIPDKRFLGTMYPIDNESEIYNTTYPFITQINFLDLSNKIMASDGVKSDYELNPYSIDYGLYDSDNPINPPKGQKQPPELIDPSGLYLSVLLLNNTIDVEDVLRKGILIKYSVKKIDAKKELLSTTYSDGNRQRTMPVGVSFVTSEPSKEPDWISTEANISVNINTIANILDERFNLVREAAITKERIKEKLLDGIKGAVNTFESSGLVLDIEEGKIFDMRTNEFVDAGSDDVITLTARPTTK